MNIVTWLWNVPGYRSQFDWSHVSLLREQVRRHYPHAHRFVCVSNIPGKPSGVGIERLHDREDFADVASPHGGPNPSCYRRLRLFDPAFFPGERIVSLDLDVVLTGDVTPLWHREEDIVLLKDSGKHGGYNGGMTLLTGGCRSEVWTRFDAMTSPQQALLAGRFGSDQGWISHVLGDGEATWSKADGVYSYRNEIQPSGTLPPDARMVFFHGANVDPWLPHMRRIEWIASAYSGLDSPPLSSPSPPL